ncbi:MAG: hypothetical protein Q8J89_14470 [Caulobacter sp.]|nr:hypothetical protein [Caulobacter sp.]
MAGFTLVALVALAQQPRGSDINLGGTPFVVDAWGPAVYAVNSPSGSRPWASVTFWPPKTGTVGEWKVNWQNIPKSRAGTSCADEEKWARALAERAGFAVRSVSVEAGNCKKYWGWSEALDSHGSIVVEPVAATAAKGSASSAGPHAYCWATREVDNGTRRTHYFSRVWSMGADGPTIGFQPQFQSFVSARYSSRGGASAQCLRFFGRQEAEMRMNNLAADARRNGNDVVFTDWWPNAAPPEANAAAERAAQAREEAAAARAREAAAEAERTARLNREVAERDAAIKRRNAETKAADERRQREYRDALARQQAEVERLKREDAAARARYDAEMAAWRARVAACKAGDYAQCQ